MFNLRSALDHILVAMIPDDQVEKQSFPIFTDVLDGKDSLSGCVPPSEGTTRMETEETPGLQANAPSSSDPMAPYRHVRELTDPQYVSLAILSALQNAEKHRHLMVVSNGLRDAKLWVHLPGGRSFGTNPKRSPRTTCCETAQK